VLPHLQTWGRCIAPDLIGMYDSDKLPDSGPGSYRFVEQALGFDWANRRREAVKGIAFMEASVAPQDRDHWDKIGMR
jgi:haloalkane dehalogenase